MGMRRCFGDSKVQQQESWRKWYIETLLPSLTNSKNAGNSGNSDKNSGSENHENRFLEVDLYRFILDNISYGFAILKNSIHLLAA